MTIALPPYGLSINDFVVGLTPATWQAMTVAATPSELELLLPKFKLTWEDSLNEYLKALGMRRAFVQGGADFTRLSRTMGAHLFLSEVKQKTFVDVNEEGTEAAAVTSATVLVSGPLQVRVDRTFVFAIRERLSGTIVFIGKVGESVSRTVVILTGLTSVVLFPLLRIFLKRRLIAAGLLA